MGEIRKYSCECGYEQDAFVGAGLNGRNAYMISRFFPDEAEQLLSKKELLQMYLLKNALAECENCKKLVILPQFVYQKKGSEEIQSLIKECPDCKEAVLVHEDIENVQCPKCRRRLEYRVTGNWD